MIYFHDSKGILMRLNRYLSASGYTSRRKSEAIIREGHVKVNGLVASHPSIQVDPDNDTVTVDDILLVVNPEKRYYVMNKPIGVIVSHGDTHGRANVFDLLGSETRGVFPVGRLDADTSGVLLFTDDGEMTYQLTHPSFGVEKVYRAEVKGRVIKEDVQKLKEGLKLDDGPAAPARMVILESDEDGSIVEITMHEGRKRQVRRMLGRIGHPVRALERISFGGITVRDIPLGGYRPLKAREIECLLATLHHNEKKAVSLYSTEDAQ